jgi:phenylacetate-CoA ligase
MVVRAGLYDSKTKVRLIRDLRPTMVSGTVSYLLHLLEVAAKLGIDLKQCGVRMVASVGEPGAALQATRRRLAEAWGAAVGDGYGLTEIFPLGGSCMHSNSIHLCDDIALTEIVDPKTGETVPAGMPGEVVYTNLIGDTQPLLRYRSRDIARVAPPAPCACGHTGTRLLNSVEGRVDDMIWYRGANLFPSAVESVVLNFTDLAHEFQIVVDGSHALPNMTIRVEMLRDMNQEERASLARNVSEALTATLGVNSQLELVSPGTLPRSEGRTKVRRAFDQRKL